MELSLKNYLMTRLFHFLSKLFGFRLLAKLMVIYRTVDLNQYRGSVTVRSYDEGGGWLASLSGPPALNFPGSEDKLVWPFTLALLDYDPKQSTHRRILQTIYQVWQSFIYIDTF